MIRATFSGCLSLLRKIWRRARPTYLVLVNYRVPKGSLKTHQFNKGIIHASKMGVP
ncbi:hypothetical protein [Wielerella bovis]|uniref:hypothetical protein n=1 Tax=Wielerella bovis TaxID=2917790 RepID=UPI0020191BED|nr:hypothetical protein [Wielerella bovis]ULJ60881.1 hypothetical protein MIS44_03205 [Wielerella bovis]